MDCISMQRSLSFSRDVPGSSSVASKYRMPSTPKQPGALRRSSKSKIAKPPLPQNWAELVGEASLEKYSKEEIKRQEVCNQVSENTACSGEIHVHMLFLSLSLARQFIPSLRLRVNRWMISE